MKGIMNMSWRNKTMEIKRELIKILEYYQDQTAIIMTDDLKDDIKDAILDNNTTFVWKNNEETLNIISDTLKYDNYCILAGYATGPLFTVSLYLTDIKELKTIYIID